MPYIETKSRAYFDEHPNEAKLDGDVTYVFYKRLVKMWKEEPRWRTYASMRKAQVDVRLISWVRDLVLALVKNGTDIATIAQAYVAAVDEIKFRYVDLYEQQKRLENGDIE